MQYYIVDAFTDQPFGGNPAGVVLLDGDVFPNETLMLQIAAELRYSETAFVRRDAEKEFTIRYFTPMAEVELCGHATIASFAICIGNLASLAGASVTQKPAISMSRRDRGC